MIVAWLLVLRRPRLILSLLWWPAMALFVVVARALVRGHAAASFPQFVHYFFVVQHFQRFAQSGFNNVQPFWFYPVVLVVLTLPWSLWLPASVRRSYLGDPQRGPVRILLWLWVLALTVFFSLPQSKLVGYILPVSFPLALLIADGASLWATGGPRGRRLWQASAVIAAGISLGAISLSLHYADRSQRSLGVALANRVAPRDTVVFLRSYYFDVPFYAHLSHPVLVVDDWDKPELTARDNWARELLDAQHFMPPSAKPVLVVPAALKLATCTTAPVWIVGAVSALAQHPELAGATEIARHGADRAVAPQSAARRPVSLRQAASKCPARTHQISDDSNRHQHECEQHVVPDVAPAQQCRVRELVGGETGRRHAEETPGGLQPGRPLRAEGQQPMARQRHEERHHPARHVGHQRQLPETADQQHDHGQMHGRGRGPHGDEAGDATGVASRS